NSVYPAGFLPQFEGRIADISVTAGYRGALTDRLHYDLSLSHGRNALRYTVDDTINPSMGPSSRTRFYIGRLEQRESDANADFTYEWNAGLKTPVSVAFGAERRRESYRIGAGDTASWLVGAWGRPQTVEFPDGTTFVNPGLSAGTNGIPGYSPATVVDKGRT